MMDDAASRFNEIYDSTYKATLAFITAKCKRTSDINDIFQETYMELYQALLSRGAGYVKHERAFVTRLAKQKLSRYYSLRERLDKSVSLGEELALSDFDADAFNTEDFMVDQLLIERARDFIKSKPEGVKKVFYLFYDVGLSIPEIAKLLSLSESNVKNKLYRTLRELRSLLQ